MTSERAHASIPPHVYFQSGSAKLDRQHEVTLDHAAAWLRSANAKTMYIEANADRVGSAESNLRLSRLRGEAFKAALVRRGFRPDQITVRAYGESHLVVETPDGVAEPQNRWAIVFIDTVAPTPGSRTTPQTTSRR